MTTTYILTENLNIVADTTDNTASDMDAMYAWLHEVDSSNDLEQHPEIAHALYAFQQEIDCEVA